MPEISWWLEARLTRWLTGFALCCVASVGWPAPRTPSNAGEVLERLAVKAGDPDASRLKQYQQAVNRAPKDAQAVAALARLYFELAMAHGDPRYVGYADALINSYPAPLSAEILFVRSLLLQYRHAFEDAKGDLRAALAAQPDFAEAHGWLAAIALVQADYAGAGQACTA